MRKKLILLTIFGLAGRTHAAQIAAPDTLEDIITNTAGYLTKLQASQDPQKQLSTLLSLVEDGIKSSAASPALVKTTKDYINALNLLVDKVSALNDPKLSNVVQNAVEQSLESFAKKYTDSTTLQGVFNNTNLNDFGRDLLNWFKEKLGLNGALKQESISELQGKLTSLKSQITNLQPSTSSAALTPQQQKAQSDRAIKALMPKQLMPKQQPTQSQASKSTGTTIDTQTDIPGTSSMDTQTETTTATRETQTEAEAISEKKFYNPDGKLVKIIRYNAETNRPLESILYNPATGEIQKVNKFDEHGDLVSTTEPTKDTSTKADTGAARRGGPAAPELGAPVATTGAVRRGGPAAPPPPPLTVDKAPTKPQQTTPEELAKRDAARKKAEDAARQSELNKELLEKIQGRRSAVAGGMPEKQSSTAPKEMSPEEKNAEEISKLESQIRILEKKIKSHNEGITSAQKDKTVITERIAALKKLASTSNQVEAVEAFLQKAAAIPPQEQGNDSENSSWDDYTAINTEQVAKTGAGEQPAVINRVTSALQPAVEPVGADTNAVDGRPIDEPVNRPLLFNE